MFGFIKHYSRNEDGAVTVDWVVLCAGIVLIALLAVAAVENGLGAPVQSTGEYISTRMD